MFLSLNCYIKTGIKLLLFIFHPKLMLNLNIVPEGKKTVKCSKHNYGKFFIRTGKGEKAGQFSESGQSRWGEGSISEVRPVLSG